MPTLPHQVLIGAINTPYPQKSNEKLFSIKHLGTDAIDIAKTELEISRPALPIRTFGDKSIDPVPYQREFVEGYELGYRKMMNRRHIISDMIKNLRCQVRFILRPTSQYAFMLNALLFPENLVDQQAADKLLAYLKPTKIVSNSKVARDILLEEKKDILLGDIPYFTLNSNSTSLQSPRMVFESSFDLSTIENARLAIEGMSEVRLQHDKRLVAEGFCQIKIHEAEYLSKGHIGYESDLFKNILSQVTVENPDVLTDFVASMGIKTKGEGQETGWFSGVYGDYPLSYDSKAFISLHDSGGILLLFDHITKENVKYRDLFESAKRGLISQKNLMSVHYDTIHSIISGRASFDYILEHNQKRMIKLEQELDGLIGHEDMVGDVYMGAMGLALLAGSFKATNRDLLKKTYDWLKKVSFEESKAGIAHGHLGRLWTLFRLSYQLEDIESSRAYYQIVIELDFIADGYCNGKAGHLMIVAEMQALLNLESTAYGLALNATQLVDGQVIDISTCHGVSGILQAILFAYKTSGDERLLGLARGYWTKCLVMAQKNGYMTGEENRDYIMGYFLGWSGFSDSANLLDMYLKGHKPWVPLNLSGDIYQDIKGGMNEMFGCD